MTEISSSDASAPSSLPDPSDVLVILLSGELDLKTAPELDQVLRDAEQEGTRSLVVDLGGLEFVDSTGLRVLVDAHRRAATAEWALSLLPARAPAVRRLFELVGFNTFLVEDPMPQVSAAGRQVRLHLGREPEDADLSPAS